MEFTPHRERDGGPVINWLADRLMNLSSILMKIALPYALMYKMVLEDEIDEDDEDSKLERNRLEHSDTTFFTHPITKCAGEVCTIHNRSNHSMRDFPQLWRADRGIIERVCPHGVGHPDPDEYLVLNGVDDGVHGCDGCCNSSANKQKKRKI